ncbi:MAG: hypothetical protein JJ855_04350 [Rhodospirillales bacterium]|nr:hypothetical protein [Rhodospirillales bacterium]
MNFIHDGFVLVHGDDRVFAKLLDVEETTATIEYFHSVAERATEQVDLADLSRVELPPETRVFIEISPGHWRVGRVRSHLSEFGSANRYEVRFPNQDNQDLSEIDLYVRCLDVYADPSETLAAGCSETQAVADRRRKALKTIRMLRSACEGLTGPYSSAIELMPHQMSSVRKVLQDTLVRYLLADEVGLGKTIEAGCIIRQMLLDRPDLETLVLVPDSLLSQWREELEKRFYISPRDQNVRILGYGASLEIQQAPDLLVVDEAHRVIATNPDEEDQLGNHIQSLAHKSESLLLLSATPALGDEARLFGLLHLLDPSAYPIGDLDGFRRKVQSRQEIGRLLMTIQPGGTAFVVRAQAKSAMEMFPDDTYVTSIANDLLGAGEDVEKRDRSTVLLRDHIARTYRIHDRLIRSRRADAEGWAMRPRSEPWPNLSHVRIVPNQTSWSTDLSNALEEWRVVAASFATESDAQLFRRWRDLVSISFLGRESIARYVDSLEPIFEGEKEYLDALKTVATSDFEREVRIKTLCAEVKAWRAGQGNSLSQKTPKIACFVSDEDEAATIYTEFRQCFGPYDVLNLSETSDPLERERKISSFRDDAQCWILVGSRHDEEGLNLQFMSAIFHLDLPADVGRLEQRIGRLDRFGRTLPKLEHRIYLPDDDEEAPWYAWINVLFNGFRIFNGSVSDIQFQLETLDRLIWSRFLSEGSGCAEELAEQVAAAIDEEREKLNEQHALDQIANLSDDAVSFIDRMEEAEEDETQLNKAVLNWMNGVLHIDQDPQNPERNQTHRVFIYKPLLPIIPWERVLSSSVDRPLTWRRNLSQTSKEIPILLRPGCDLLDALERISNWDDRGTAYATWRVDPQASDIWVGFRWVWVVGPDLSDGTAVWRTKKRPDLHRRAEAYLPIVTLDFWTDTSGDTVADNELVERLNQPYVKRPNHVGVYDINLGSRPDALSEIMDPTVLRDTIRDLRLRAEEHVWQHDDVADALERAKEKLYRDDSLIRHSLERRQAYLQREFEQIYEGVEDAIADLDSLKRAIENPRLRLDECGLLVVSPEPPDA